MRSSSFSFFVSSPPCVILSEEKACPEPCRREPRIFLNAKARQRKYRHRRTPRDRSLSTSRRTCAQRSLRSGGTRVSFRERGMVEDASHLESAGTSMRCRNCSAENPEGAKFCIQCASPFRRLCQKCGFENPLEARFCAECASPLSADHAAQPSRTPTSPTSSSIRPDGGNREEQSLEGERKTVTALFADIKGSTQLEQDLDPGEARALGDPALK